MIAINTSGCLGNSQNEKEMYEVNRVDMVVSEARSIAVSDYLNGKNSYPDGMTYTVLTSNGSVTFKNGNFQHATIEFPNGTVASYDFNKNKDRYDYVIKYTNGKTLKVSR